MRAFLWGSLAIVLGLVAFTLVVGAGEYIGHSIFGIRGDANDPAAIKELMKTMPLGALVAVVLAWVLGAFAGAWVSTSLAPARNTAFGLVIGVLGLAATFANLLMIPHPVWMWVAGVAAPLPAAYLGAWLARGRTVAAV